MTGEYHLFNDAYGSLLGNAIQGIGDFNGDQYDDIALAAKNYTLKKSVLDSNGLLINKDEHKIGEVYVVFGKPQSDTPPPVEEPEIENQR